MVGVWIGCPRRLTSRLVSKLSIANVSGIQIDDSRLATVYGPQSSPHWLYVGIQR
jgi:hypothetical protein